jgi:SAM-dependent methyltransferase
VTEAHDRALALALESQAAGDATGWLERLYAEAGQDPARVPWADRVGNPNLVGWLDRRAAGGGAPGGGEPGDGHGGRALVVGCGLGHDAEELARRGYDVTAFDIAPSAVAWARQVHPASPVTYAVADLLAAPAEWAGAFDLVFEAYTVQVLRGEPRRAALRALPRFVAPGGTLLVVARAREESDPEGDLPWPLTAAELGGFEGLETVAFEDYPDEGGNRRFRVEARRPA